MYSKFKILASFCFLCALLGSHLSFAEDNPSYTENCNTIYDYRSGQDRPYLFIEFCGVAKKIILLNTANPSGYKHSITLNKKAYDYLHEKISQQIKSAKDSKETCQHPHSIFTPSISKNKLSFCPQISNINLNEEIKILLKN